MLQAKAVHTRAAREGNEKFLKKLQSIHPHRNSAQAANHSSAMGLNPLQRLDQESERFGESKGEAVEATSRLLG